MKHKTTFEKLPQANTGRSKNWKTLRAICLLLFLSVSFTAYSQITVNVKDISLRASLKKIEQVSNYKFFYNESLPELNRKVSLNVKDATIEQTMQQLLGGMDLAYKKEQDNVIVLIRKAQDKSITKKITGTVVDEKGEPVIGASIVIKGESHGTITDFDGKFTLADVPEKGILTVSYIGYKTVDLSATGQTFVKVVLQEDSKMIDEVVVVGYGVQSQKLVTTSISKVKMENIDQGNDYNPIKMLQGRVAGVNISSASGTPGEAPNVTVRGIGSVSGGSSPLYVVDGIPSEKYPNLNPNDIESMEVLKDASAAAIYGSRANAGVVLITTKSGQQGKTKIEVSGRYGFAYLASDIEMANSMEYMNTMQAAIDNYNVQMGANLQLYVPSQIQETNWVKEISRKNSKTGTGSISISGGNEKTTFFASLGANTQEGYLNKSSYDQYNMRAKFTHKINNLFKLNMNMAGSASRSDLLEETSTSLKVLRTAREEQPWYSPYKEDGTSYKVNGTDILRHNPVMLINEEDWVAKKYQLSGVFSIDVTPFKGFKYTPTVSVYGILDNTSKKLSDKHDARKNSSGWGALAEQKDQSFRYVIDNIFSYNNEWNKLIYSVMLGHSFEKYTYEQFGAKSDNYANGAFPSSNFDLINAGPNIYAGNISYTSYALESYFGRIALNWDNKYILNASLRSDGSSRFAKNKRYGYFPSASFAWRASNEEFFPKNKYVNDAKLRLSWGMTGSMAGVSNYAPLSLISAGGASYNGSAGFQISQDARALTWEKASQFNIGFDIEMFQSRLTLNIDMFYQKTTDLLFKKPVNATTGYTTLQSNIGSLENKGLELALNGKIFTGKFKWDLGGNISFVKNKLLSLIEGNDMYIVPSSGSNLLGGSMHALINGQPISTFYMLKMEGIYQRDDEVPAKLYAKGVRAGDVKYFDYNEDGDISDADRMNVGKAIPDFYGGITSNFSYKGFDLSLFGQFSVGGKVMSAWRGVNGSEGTDHLGLALSNVKVNDRGESVEQYFNVSKEVANGYWRGEGTSNTIPRPVRIGVHTGYDYDYNVQTSTRYLEDASYFKLKTVTLGYTLPESVVKKLRVNSLRVYVSADNLLTLTKYSGYDPETSFSGSPGDSNYGVDFGLQPVLRTFIFGLNLNF
mgnify:FL=1